MSEARAQILERLRSARDGLPPAPPRPEHYQTVMQVEDDSPAALLARFHRRAGTAGGRGIRGRG